MTDLEPDALPEDPAPAAPDAPPPAPAPHVSLVDRVAALETGSETRLIAVEDRITELITRYNTFVNDVTRELGL